MILTGMFKWKVQTHQDQKRRDRWRSFSLMWWGSFTKNLSWQMKQSILHVTVTFCDNCMKMCKHFALNVGHKRPGCCITTKHHETFHFQVGFSPNTTRLSSPTHPSCLTWPLVTLFFFSGSKNSQIWHNWGDQGRDAGSTHHPHRSRLLGCI